MKAYKRFQEDRVVEALPLAVFQPNYTRIAHSLGMSVSTVFGIWKRLREEDRVRVRIEVKPNGGGARWLLVRRK